MRHRRLRPTTVRYPLIRLRRMASIGIFCGPEVTFRSELKKCTNWSSTLMIQSGARNVPALDHSAGKLAAANADEGHVIDLEPAEQRARRSASRGRRHSSRKTARETRYRHSWPRDPKTDIAVEYVLVLDLRNIAAAEIAVPARVTIPGDLEK